jgi:O-succinylbenzoic acid--CoA ligase
MSEWYTPLDGVAVRQDEEGCLLIDAPSLSTDILHTNDVVRMHDDKRRFMVVGRKDNVVCCGGVKIQAEEVEKCLQPYVHVPFFIGKEKDEKFGEIVVMVAETENKKLLEDIIGNVLPKYWIPRKIYTVSQLPLTQTGKPLRNLNVLE